MATQIFRELDELVDVPITFWSETPVRYSFISDKYPVLSSDREVKEYFSSTSNKFMLCIGNPVARKLLADRFERLGGVLTSYFSPDAEIAAQVMMGQGVTVLAHTIIEPGVKIGTGTLLNKKSNIAHGTIIGDFCEIGPDVMITGEVELGHDCFLGARAMILPKIKIGNNVTISAGAIVRKDIPDNSLVAAPKSIILKKRTSV